MLLYFWDIANYGDLQPDIALFDLLQNIQGWTNLERMWQIPFSNNNNAKTTLKVPNPEMPLRCPRLDVSNKKVCNMKVSEKCWLLSGSFGAIFAMD